MFLLHSSLRCWRTWRLARYRSTLFCCRAMPRWSSACWPCSFSRSFSASATSLLRRSVCSSISAGVKRLRVSTRSRESRRGRKGGRARTFDTAVEHLDLLAELGELLLLDLEVGGRAVVLVAVVGARTGRVERVEAGPKLLAATAQVLVELDLEHVLLGRELRGGGENDVRERQRQEGRRERERTHLGQALGQVDELLLLGLDLLAEALHRVLLGAAQAFLERALDLGAPQLALALERAHVALVLGELLVEAREARPSPVGLVLEPHRLVDERLALLDGALQALLGDLDLAEDVRHLLVERDELVPDLGVVRAQLGVAVLGRLDGLDGVEARAAHVVVAARERALAVVLVAVEGDGVQAVRARVGAGDLERLTDDGAPKDLLERRAELLGELELVDPARRSAAASVTRSSSQTSSSW